MATAKKSSGDREVGEIMLNEVFAEVQRLNAAAGPTLVQKGSRSGNMTFNPRIVIDENGGKHYTCFVDIYTQRSSKAGIEMSMEWSSTNSEQFKQALKVLSPALLALAKEGFLSDTFTVGKISKEGKETELYAPDELKPGMLSLSEADE
ncbi:MAG TPA: hypothetical protein VED37_17670 [Ktedonobacteraceae bacterium]|nr:hypothetical protein [Ktedonobacteraceae bacterium]